MFNGLVVDIVKQETTIILFNANVDMVNAKIVMFRGSMRLVFNKWSIIEDYIGPGPPPESIGNFSSLQILILSGTVFTANVHKHFFFEVIVQDGFKK